MAFPHGLRALNHAEFRLFFAAQMVAQVGTWMQTVGQSWLVLQLTDSPLKLGLLGTVQFGPILLFSIVSGAIADRLPKRRLLIGTQTTLATQAWLLAVLVWSGHAEYWHVCVLATIVGFANVVDMPARQSFIAEMVGKADLVNAVALNSAAFNAARIVGPAIGGLLIARYGVAPAFVMNGLGFVVVIVALSMLAVEGHPRRTASSTMIQDIAEGLAYSLRTPRIRLIMGLLFVVSISVFNFSVYVPLLARHVLDLGAEGFGYLMAALGVGAVTGALTLGMVGSRQPPPRAMFVATLIACSGLFSLAFVHHVRPAVVLLVVTGYFGTMLVAAANTALQLSAPDELRGRVMSLYALIWGGVFPIGSFVVGAVSEAWGVPRAFLTSGTFGLTATAALALWWTTRARAH